MNHINKVLKFGGDEEFTNKITEQSKTENLWSSRKTDSENIQKIEEGFQAGGSAQVKGPEGGIQIVAGHVGDTSVTERPPTTPIVRCVVGMVVPIRGRPDPEVPVPAFRDRGRFFWPGPLESPQPSSTSLPTLY